MLLTAFGTGHQHSEENKHCLIQWHDKSCCLSPADFDQFVVFHEFPSLILVQHLAYYVPYHQ